uniref:DNA polymerase subunit gamma-1-like isoform X1 n=2 Tax=Myxine glutinosa TaxID=7769 RepID=UPI00358F9F05
MLFSTFRRRPISAMLFKSPFCFCKTQWMIRKCLKMNAVTFSTKEIIKDPHRAVGDNGIEHKTTETNVDSLKIPKKVCKTDKETASRMNPLNIQMLSRQLHEQLFGSKEVSYSEESVHRSVEHLHEHGLWGRPTPPPLPELNIDLPELEAPDLDQHFRAIASQQTLPYLRASGALVSACTLPPRPAKWAYSPGWTRYSNGTDGPGTPVPFPDDAGLVFDVEVCLSAGNCPTLAVAASTNAWYSWCSHRLTEKRYTWPCDVSISDLIPLETDNAGVDQASQQVNLPRLIVGHNVSFDRTYIKEQYLLQGTRLRFLDTLSLHMATSGLTGLQRSLWIAKQRGSSKNFSVAKHSKNQYRPKSASLALGSWHWADVSSVNNLSDVHNLYVGGKTLDKTSRNIFVSGSIDDVRSRFQELVSYCADDVTATHEVFCQLLPIFLERCPHPVTLAGMLEMGQCYLPVNENWPRYLAQAEATYEELTTELHSTLARLADQSCSLLHQDIYQEDPWLWDMDWSTREFKLKIDKQKSKSGNCSPEVRNFKEPDIEEDCGPISEQQEEVPSQGIALLTQLKSKTAVRLRKRIQHLPAHPAWYRQLCPQWSDSNWAPGPTLLGLGMRVTPKLLRLTWIGYPLHYKTEYGWGYVVPGHQLDNMEAVDAQLPLRTLQAACVMFTNQQAVVRNSFDPDSSSFTTSDAWKEIEKIGRLELMENHGLLQENDIDEVPADESSSNIKNTDFEEQANVAGCWFYRLPHKDGDDKRVGNPLAKDFMSKIEDSTLQAWGGPDNEGAAKALEINKMVSFWRNANKRINSQMVVWLKKEELPYQLRQFTVNEDVCFGAILPQVITAGTVTRRAVEPTWLTASNARIDRVGSELKCMVQAPPGYHIVGADVDSQELWIAALIGDAQFAGIHGCTAFGWMTLQGRRIDDTDLHSRTAQTACITRNQAKIFNYGRIYGAGRPFAERLLQQFNPTISPQDTSSTAQRAYAATKGVRKFHLSEEGLWLVSVLGLDVDIDDEGHVFSKDLKHIQQAAARRSRGKKWRLTDGMRWVGGSESAMFNRLEEIAGSDTPRTPVLEACISRALEPSSVGDEFLPSRVNWVVQSSAVDYLHLMLVALRWLCEKYSIPARLSISIHDELRLLTPSADRYRTALALQIANLLTRAMFAWQLGMHDLPQSVAFFSSVEVDSCLRKDVHNDAITPSNSTGLRRRYGIESGEELDIYDLIKKTGGSLKSADVDHDVNCPAGHA